MAHIKQLFDKNFLEYASYVIKDRAIADIDDGLKPVQRRILYTLYLMHDGGTHKVANVVGRTMALHPHGDASIYEALVNLANKELFLEKQGNFGNIATGDPAAASRYIECALLPFAKELLFKKELTQFVPSYDGKMEEPVTLPVKMPLVLMLGTEGIAVGMSTKILPHNFIECLEAVRHQLKSEPYQLFPDFPLGGLVDCSQYNDGMGKVIARARIDLSDPKKIVIRELPFGITVESMIESIEDAAKKGRIKIGSIHDFTAEEVEIAIELPRGLYAKDVEEALYAFTSCEVSISVNCLVIKERRPELMSISSIISYHSKRLVHLLESELTLERTALTDKIRIRTLERIFIEERIYKLIEEMKSASAVDKAVKEGFKPFEEVAYIGSVTAGDVEVLLRIPIRRISLFDINKNRKELEMMEKRIKEINKILTDLTSYACSYLSDLIESQSANYPRKTELSNFKKVDIREAAIRNLKLRVDSEKGYIGFNLSSGEVIADVSVYDRVLVIKGDGSYFVSEVSEKLFVGKNILHAALVDKEEMETTIYNVIYKNNDTHYPYIKRFKITQFITGKTYSSIIPENATFLAFGLGDKLVAIPTFTEKTLLKDERFAVSDYLIKGIQAGGVRLKARQVKAVKLK